MKLIETAWQDYLARVIPPDAPPVQVQESKRAFFAGANAVWKTLEASFQAGDPNKEPTDADCAILESIDKELQEFCDAVLRGDA
jgi:hypothetical protein